LCYEKHYVNFQIWQGVEKSNTLEYEQVKAEDYGLKWEAYHVNYTGYLSDCGGNKADFMDRNFLQRSLDAHRRIQILIHPQWWGELV
jgi:hypothetical protein